MIYSCYFSYRACSYCTVNCKLKADKTFHFTFAHERRKIRTHGKNKLGSGIRDRANLKIEDEERRKGSSKAPMKARIEAIFFDYIDTKFTGLDYTLYSDCNQLQQVA